MIRYMLKNKPTVRLHIKRSQFPNMVFMDAILPKDETIQSAPQSIHIIQRWKAIQQ